ncbi:MAG: hypothetical protein ACRD2P_17390 [Terriglobia bacterium]
MIGDEKVKVFAFVSGPLMATIPPSVGAFDTIELVYVDAGRNQFVAPTPAFWLNEISPL